MNWWIIGKISCLIFLAACVSAALLQVLLRYRKTRTITPNKILFAGTFLSAMVYFLPMYFTELASFPLADRWFQTILLSLQHAFRLFALDGDYLDWITVFQYPDEATKRLYTSFGAVLHAFAPLLTFGFILSFFKNLSAHIRYELSFWTDVHIFSELNEKTLALATDIVNNDKRIWKILPKELIIFTDILEKKEETSMDLIEDAQEIRAILFRKDLEAIKFRRNFFSRKLNFYLISDDESEKIRHARHIMQRYDAEDVVLRVFSDDIRSNLLLASKTVSHMKVLRINDIQSLIYHNLYTNGINLFHRARESANGKVISAIIVGLGRYGRETLKALTWYCQLQGYTLKINAFDSDEKALEKFTDLCPELMSSEYNGQSTEGEPYYEIRIHSGVDVSVPEFSKEISKIDDATYIFVCLGNDEINLETATKIRTICERVNYTGDHHKPDIETVIYDSNLRKAMGITWADVWDSAEYPEHIHGVTNFKKQPYNIHMIGNLEHFYSVETVIESKLVAEGWKVHWRYYTNGNPVKEQDKELEKSAQNSFWQYEYCYRSSIAKAIHEQLRIDMGLKIPGIEKPWKDRTQEEKIAIGRVEHVRWNAYMRAEGYCWSGTNDEKSRNDLAMVHPHLVPVTELKDEVLQKDA